MPFYEYECRQCGARFDALLSMSNRDKEEKELSCPQCGAQKARRLISSFATVTSPGSTCPSSGAPACSPGG